jgi:hypothetical protein
MRFAFVGFSRSGGFQPPTKGRDEQLALSGVERVSSLNLWDVTEAQRTSLQSAAPSFKKALGNAIQEVTHIKVPVSTHDSGCNIRSRRNDR